jgi:hypothetical protein
MKTSHRISSGVSAILGLIIDDLPKQPNQISCRQKEITISKLREKRVSTGRRKARIGMNK